MVRLNICRRFGLLLAVLLTSVSTLIAQDDTSFSLLDEPAVPQGEEVQNAFKTTKVVNLQSIELIDAGVFDFKMSHRFGAVNSGAVNAFGLDVATIRLGGEYGLNRRTMLGLGRYNVKSEKGVDAYVKYKLISQTTDNKNPLSVLLLGAVDYKNTRYQFDNARTLAVGEAIDPKDPTRFWQLSMPQRMSYVGQVIVGRKQNDKFSWQVSPTFVYYGTATTLAQAKSGKWVGFDSTTSIKTGEQGGSAMMVNSGVSQFQLALGLGMRYKITTRTSLNVEYIPVLTGRGDFRNSFSIGFDIETGGHVFQVDFTNSIGLNESLFISRNTTQWNTAGVRLGFNLHRVFTVVDPSHFSK
jgi:hypothetical protein